MDGKIKLFFNLEGQFRRFTTKKVELKGDFYEFVDCIDGKFRQLHKKFYLGREGKKC